MTTHPEQSVIDDVRVESIEHLENHVDCDVTVPEDCDQVAVFWIRAHGHAFLNGKTGNTRQRDIEKFVCADHMSVITGHYRRLHGRQCKECGLVYKVFSDYVYRVVSL